MKRLTLVSLSALLLSGCGTLPFLSDMSTGNTDTDAQQSLYSLLGIEEATDDVGADSEAAPPEVEGGDRKAPKRYESRGDVVLALLDGNDDGEVTREEFVAAVKSLKPAMVDETLLSFFSRLDVDGDDSLTSEDFPRPKRPEMRGGMRGGHPGFHSRLAHHPHGPRQQGPGGKPAEVPAGNEGDTVE